MTEAASITTRNMVAAQKGRGTTVYNLAGENIGVIRHLMLDKASGRALYAIVAFDSAFTKGKLHPLPWRLLTYREQLGGHIVDLGRHEVENAPTLEGANLEDSFTTQTGRDVDKFYDLPSYWINPSGGREELLSAAESRSWACNMSF